MHSSQEHSHYQPPSVGALMDPQYLRETVNDGVERRPSTAPASTQAHPWWGMMNSLARLFRRH